MDTPDINYIFHHLSGQMEKAMQENDNATLDKIAKELRELTERLDTHYCLQQDKS